ncbi:MAG: IclR family transcriptional regulator [Firmicutes bacterium]|nr:IclR family transcriptional regulator [Bacillota bacterium]
MAKPALLQTLDRALRVLAVFDWEHPEWGVTELAHHLQMPKSVVQKTLATFAHHGFVYQEPVRRRYRLGPRLLSLAQVAQPELARVAHRYMANLAEATKETVKLTVVDGNQTVIAHAVESPQSLRMTGRVGERNDFHRGASNKVLAAYMKWEAVLDALQAHLPADHPVLLEPDRLRRELEAIASQGYAESHGEVEEGVTAVSVPVRGPLGEVEASLSIVGPSVRVTEGGCRRWLELLQQARALLERELGLKEEAFVRKGG